ncbi:MAG: ABC transporter ATP-binding protein/permease [Clostridia bacterium]|nr:ABC transporter ATP-binding protein/permease [Clostridia bacterium]
MIELKNINKTYYTDTGVTFRALSNISTTFEESGLVFILGKSGSGKSTLLNILGALDSYDSGEMWIGDKLTKKLSSNMLDYYRNTLVGFVFQEFNLIDSLSVMENVRFALDIKSDNALKKPVRKKRVLEMLEAMGIGDKANAKARNLSGGQRQRVAIARALVKEPKIILADEPTGSLDSVTGQEITEILSEISKTKLVIVVTHDVQTAIKYGDRIIEMKDGRIYRDVKRRKKGESLMAEGIDIVSDTIVRLQKDTEIDDHFNDRINDIILDSGRKSYINVDTNERKVKALFPNLRDAVSLEQSGGGVAIDGAEQANGSELLKNDNFVPYSAKRAKRIAVEFKSSKMAIGSALKMGFHNLSLKKFRLALIIIVTCISFTLFGGMNILSSIETGRALAEIIRHENIGVISVSQNSLYASDGSDVINDDIIDTFKSKHKNCNFYKQYSMMLSVEPFNDVSANLSGYYFGGFLGITEIEDMESLGFKMLYGSSKPNTSHSAIISSYAAGALIKGNTFSNTALSLSDIIEKKIYINGFEIVISGIYQSDYEPNYNLDNDLVIDAYNHVFQLFVSDDGGFLADYKNCINMNLMVGLDQIIAGSKDMIVDNRSIYVMKKNQALYDKFDTVTPVAVDNIGDREGIVVLIQFYHENKLELINLYNNNEHSYFNIGKHSSYDIQDNNNNYYYYDNNYQPDYQNNIDYVSDILISLPSSKYYISGYIITGGYTNGLALNENTYSKFLENYFRTRQLLVELSPDSSENLALINDLLSSEMQVNANFSFLFSIYMAMFLNFNGIITGAVVFLCFLAVILMYNFISTSIKLTKRNIGLLRALGVKKFHTFLVYVMEGLLTAVLTFVISAVVLLSFIPVINAAISSSVGMYLPIMLVNPSVFLLMAALSLFVSVAATFIPWFKFAKITPVEAISDRKDK